MTVTIVPGDLDAFQSMEGSEKADWRRRAIDAIGKACTDRGQVRVVAGHYVFRSEKQEAGRPVVIEHDSKILTHILYLDFPAEIVARCRLDDTERGRASTSASPSGTDERLFLSNLPNKPQNHTLPIFISLQRSPRQTNRNLQSCAELHHLPSSVVFDYFQVKERLLAHSEISACYICLHLQAQPAFVRRQARAPRGVLGTNVHNRFYLYCGCKKGGVLTWPSPYNQRGAASTSFPVPKPATRSLQEVLLVRGMRKERYCERAEEWSVGEN